MDTAEAVTAEKVIAILRAHEPWLRAAGIRTLSLFGSVARGEARPDSDIDIMVEIAPDFPMDVFQYVGVVHAIEDLFPLPVDVSNLTAQKPHVRPSAQRDAVYAF